MCSVHGIDVHSIVYTNVHSNVLSYVKDNVHSIIGQAKSVKVNGQLIVQENTWTSSLGKGCEAGH